MSSALNNIFIICMQKKKKKKSRRKKNTCVLFARGLVSKTLKNMEVDKIIHLILSVSVGLIKINILI